MDLMGLATDERRDLLDLLTGLAERDWQTPSLCAGWTVRDVVAHVISYEDLSWPAVGALFLRGRGFDRVNALAAAGLADLDGPALTRRLAQRLRPRGLTTGLRGGIALTDAMIHTQDVRRPLQRPRTIPVERMLPALDLAVRAPTLGARRRLRGLRLQADDLDWATGAGELVHGPGEALLLGLAGRAVALAELTGPGLSTLRRRVAGG